jgi:hypothetical protein
MVPTTTRTFRSIYGVLNNRRFLCVQSMFRNVMGCSVRCRRARSHRESMPCSLDNRFTHLALSSPLVSAALAIQLPISKFGPPRANRPRRNRKLEKRGTQNDALSRRSGLGTAGSHPATVEIIQIQVPVGRTAIAVAAHSARTAYARCLDLSLLNALTIRFIDLLLFRRVLIWLAVSGPQ